MAATIEAFEPGGINYLTSKIKTWATESFAGKSAASTTSNGLMSSADKSKLDGIAKGAQVGTITGISTSAPLSGSGTSGSVALSHAKSGVTAGSKGDSSAQSPKFGGTFKALSATVNDTGHVTGLEEHIVTVPSATASATADGLMSKAHYSKLEGIAQGATANAGTVTQVSAGVGLAGDPITGSGTIKAKLRSETKLSADSVAASTQPSGRQYPVLLDAAGYLAVNVPWENTQTISGVKGNAESSYRTGNVNITAANIGLGNVNNTSDANKPISTATQAALDLKVSTSLLGAKNGVAQLDANGTVPESQLPSYVDDVVEYESSSKLPTTGEAGKIYVALDTNKTYRWSGSGYVEVGSGGVSLGTTSATAFRGDYGNTAYTHATDDSRLTTATAAGLYKVGVTAQGHVSALTSVTKADITGLGIPAQDTLNTAGSTDSTSKLFLIGATSQAASLQTYSQDTAYVGTDGHLYSNSKQAVNLSDTQALTNKTYNGYTLGAACAKAVTDSSSASAISTGTSLVTERDVYYGLPSINNSHAYNSSTAIYAPTAGGTSGYEMVGNGTTSAPVWKQPPFGDCSTAAGTAAKTVAITNFKLVSGVHVFVRFANANTASAPTLNVSSTGAYSMLFAGTVITGSNFTFKTNVVYEFVYGSNGTTTGWHLVGQSGGCTWGQLKGAAS